MKKNYILLSFVLILVLLGYFIFNGKFPDTKNFLIEKKQINSSGEDKIYIDSDGLFRFAYPDFVAINELVEAGSNGEERKVVLGQGKGGKTDFQIVVSPFTDNDPITEQKIRKDIPDQIIREAQNIQIKGAFGVAFLSSPEGSEDIREVWFSHNGFLYQISALSQMDQHVAGMIDTWVWGEQ